jgi:hypothetical protein
MDVIELEFRFTLLRFTYTFKVLFNITSLVLNNGRRRTYKAVNAAVAAQLGRFVSRLYALSRACFTSHVELTRCTCSTCVFQIAVLQSLDLMLTINRELRPAHAPRNSHHSPACPTIPTATHAVPSNPTLLILLEPEQLQNRFCWCDCSLEWFVRFARDKTITSESPFIFLLFSILESHDSMLSCGWSVNVFVRVSRTNSPFAASYAAHPLPSVQSTSSGAV